MGSRTHFLELNVWTQRIPSQRSRGTEHQKTQIINVSRRRLLRSTLHGTLFDSCCGIWEVTPCRPISLAGTPCASDVIKALIPLSSVNKKSPSGFTGTTDYPVDKVVVIESCNSGLPSTMLFIGSKCSFSGRGIISQTRLACFVSKTQRDVSAVTTPFVKSYMLGHQSPVR